MMWDVWWPLGSKREFSVSLCGRIHLEDRPWTLRYTQGGDRRACEVTENTQGDDGRPAR